MTFQRLLLAATPALVLLLLLAPPAAAVIGSESGATYMGDAIGRNNVVVYARTVVHSNPSQEIKPEWADCSFALDNLRKAGCGNIEAWTCALLWGTCGKCGWGSCIKATFYVLSPLPQAQCLQALNLGQGLTSSGPNITVVSGPSPLDQVVQAVFGKPSCPV
ncbi:hypothetical protein QJQ45_000797 [Haematococcus lacustris]|nr:hypothetical protein QJQ45_000797 [Haematococcus lacustris]